MVVDPGPMTVASDPPPTRSAPPERLHALDGLRALAVSLVLLHHLGGAAAAPALAGRWSAWLGVLTSQGTASGVELFFVLSAIVLVRPYATGQRTMALGKYFWRRAQRLYPPYWGAWMLSGFAVWVATAYPTWWTEGAALPRFTWQDWFAQVGLVYAGSAPFNFAWWSLTVEVCFYVVVPALVWALVRVRSAAGARVALLAASILLAQFGPALIAAVIGTSHMTAPVLQLLAYASCFCGGLLLAQQPLARVFAVSALFLGIGWVAIALGEPRLNPHIGWGLIHLAAVSSAIDRPTSWSRALSGPNMVWLGERSYSLFLTHFAVIGLVCHAASLAFHAKSAGYFAFSRLASLVLSVWVAMLLFHWLERRFARNLTTADMFWPPLMTPRRRVNGFLHG